MPKPIVASSKPAAKKSARAEKPAPVSDIGAIVSVVRNLKSEDYNVIKE